MKKFKFAKMVRSKAVKKLEKPGIIAKINDLTDQEYKTELFKKLFEEAEEVKDAKSKTETTEEIADALEVLLAIAKSQNIELSEIENARKLKIEKRGDFSAKKRVLWIGLDEKSTDPVVQELLKYCLNDPEKYPEIE